MVVVTVAIPPAAGQDVAVAVREHTVIVTGAHAFRHELELGPEADMARLHAQLYGGTLELRAPRSTPLPERRIPLKVLR